MMIKQQRGGRLVDQNGKRTNECPNMWRSATYEVWSEPFQRWVRSEHVATIKPEQSATDAITSYAREQSLPLQNVRMMIADF